MKDASARESTAEPRADGPFGGARRNEIKW
jgi:hypothetical protein